MFLNHWRCSSRDWTITQGECWQDPCLIGIRRSFHPILGLPLWLSWERILLQCGRPGSIPWLERSPREGKGYPSRYSGLENSMDYIVHGVAKSQTGPSDSLFFLFQKIEEKGTLPSSFYDASFNLILNSDKDSTKIKLQTNTPHEYRCKNS